MATSKSTANNKPPLRPNGATEPWTLPLSIGMCWVVLLDSVAPKNGYELEFGGLAS